MHGERTSSRERCTECARDVTAEQHLRHLAVSVQRVRIPRLDAVLAAFPGALINLELKPTAGAFAGALVALLRDARALDRVCLGSEDDAVAASLVEHAPDACHFYPREALTALIMAIRSGEPAPREERFHLLDMPFELAGIPLVDRTLIDRVEELRRWVNVWTVDAPADMRALIALGVDGIMTDRPDVLRVELDAAQR